MNLELRNMQLKDINKALDAIGADDFERRTAEMFLDQKGGYARAMKFIKEIRPPAQKQAKPSQINLFQGVGK